ncbi:MAG TPA: HAD-IC family P-type ATPase, partial [Clostridia bacterium]|nr:HAD-IC family P-type ATPase [Clostridia bacterium]
MADRHGERGEARQLRHNEAEGLPVSAWHSVPLDRVLEHLNTHSLAGLTEAEASSRLLRFGPNELAEAPPKTLLMRLAEQLGDFLVLILIAASVISAAVGEIVDSLVIIGIVVLNAFLGIVQESKAEKSLERLKNLSAPKATVIRDGRSRSVPASSLVPGDLVLLSAGDKVPADLRLLEAKTLKVDEAPLTGESFPVEKDAEAVLAPDASLGERSNSVFMGTAVVYGRGRGVVVRTGMKTAMGEIAEALSAAKREKTPLQRDLAGLGKALGVAFILVSAAVFVLGLLRGMAVVDIFLTSVSLAVAAIPEGLPAVVTIVLAIGVGKMVERHAIIRRLSAVETLGSTTVICSDKTGTITQNQMTAVAVLPGVWGDTVRVTGSGYEPSGEFLRSTDEGSVPVSPLGDPCLRLLLRACVLNNDASLLEGESGRWDVVGDPTEGALLVLGRKAGLDRERLLEDYPRAAEIPFDSERKRMTTIHRTPKPHRVDGAADDWIEEGYVAFVKGAPESLYGLIKWHLGPGGELLPFDENARRSVHEKGLKMAREALRVMAFAYRHLDYLPSKVTPETVESDLTFIG